MYLSPPRATASPAALEPFRIELVVRTSKLHQVVVTNDLGPFFVPVRPAPALFVITAIALVVSMQLPLFSCRLRSLISRSEPT